MKKNYWNKCKNCGKFIAYKDFYNGNAKNISYTDFHGREKLDVYHIQCNKEIKSCKEQGHKWQVTKLSLDNKKIKTLWRRQCSECGNYEQQYDPEWASKRK